ncbi:hypothetical protein L1049_003931 [Liquidambar formosana]|uniref:K Homology domain-containing protein n=1 Tax=Liquidambar formosana TaxID=63359 RepID=A0AAP0RMN1_LIQFO
MDSSFIPKRSSDPTTPTTSSDSTAKRRHHHHPHPPSSSATASPSSIITFKPPPPPLKLATNETLFRILCPAIKTGGVIGKGGAIIRQFREDTGAKIRIDDAFPGCEERVILIVADAVKTKKDGTIRDDNQSNVDETQSNSEELGSLNGGEEEGSLAQQALVRVFERILKVDEERGGGSAESEKGEEKEKKEEGGGNVVVCRLLAPSNQVGCVLGRGGKIVEKIRQESGAQIRVLPKDHIPACASQGDELIQITGNFPAVKKALLSVSSCLQDNPRADAANSAANRIIWA